MDRQFMRRMVLKPEDYRESRAKREARLSVTVDTKVAWIDN
jgi:hypothetical protein